MLDQADRVITMGCGVEEACPGAMVEAEDWGLPDPKDELPQRVREIRAMVTVRVEALLRELGINPSLLA
jgi:protein-tyrosine-phosphatase